MQLNLFLDFAKRFSHLFQQVFFLKSRVQNLSPLSNHSIISCRIILASFWSVYILGFDFHSVNIVNIANIVD